MNVGASNAAGDAFAAQMLAATRKVVALVSMQFLGSAPEPATLASYDRQGVNQLLKDHRIVPMGSGGTKHQRDARAISDQMAFAA